jgi:hypothetical protein
MLRLSVNGDERLVIQAENGRVLGKLEGRTYVTPRTVAHFFRKFQGFGLSEDVVEELMALGVDWVIFDYVGKEGNKAYRVRLMDVVRFAERWVDDSWGRPDRQLITPISKMQLVKGQ